MLCYSANGPTIIMRQYAREQSSILSEQIPQLKVAMAQESSAFDASRRK
jgi:hypothetical protein